MVDEEKLEIPKIPYSGHYPSAARYLIEEGMCATPRQIPVDLRWVYGLDIIYNFKGMTPANFAKYKDTILLLTLQEGMRYKGERRMIYAALEVHLGRLKKGRDLSERKTFMAAGNMDPDVMVYGEQALGYTVPQKYFLINKVEDILNIVQRYPDKLNLQKPYKVLRLTISIRRRKPVTGKVYAPAKPPGG